MTDDETKTAATELPMRERAGEQESLTVRNTSVFLPVLDIPERLRGVVYLVGMIGFPVVVALFVLVSLSAELKDVNKSLTNLAMRIDERPVGLEKSTDLIIYICDSLRADLQAALPTLVKELNFAVSDHSNEAFVRTVSIIDRKVSGVIRPIVRKHQRFASRFPTVGGNLASYFTVSAPSENIEEGQTEAGLVGQTYTDVGEALQAIVMNNIVHFGNVPEQFRGRVLGRLDGAENGEKEGLEGLLLAISGGAEPKVEREPVGKTVGEPVVIAPELFLALALDAVETSTTVLQDQMLTRLRVNSADLEQLD